METFKFIKGKYTNEKVVADIGVIKAVLSNGTDVTNLVNNKKFQNAAFDNGNVSDDKEIKVYTLRESLSNINPVGNVTDGGTVKISSLGVTESPSGVKLPEGAAAALSGTPATATIFNGITWNISSGDSTSTVNVKVGKATVAKSAKFTISGKVSVKMFVKASGNLVGKTVYTKENLASGGSTVTGYYNDGRKCVAIDAYETKEKVPKNPQDLGSGPYYNLVVSSQEGWKLGIDRSDDIGSTTDGTGLKDSFNITDVSFSTYKTVKVSAWQKTLDATYKKISEVEVKCDPNVYYKGYRLPNGSCFDSNGNVLDSNGDVPDTSINTVYKEKCDVTFNGVPYKYDTADKETYYTYDSNETVDSSSSNCKINNNTLAPNQTPFTKDGDDNFIYLNASVEDVQRKVVF